MMASPATKLQNTATIATIIASCVAIVSFIFGYYQFRDTQVSTRENLALQKEALLQERESKAIELFIKYNELMREIPPKMYTNYKGPEFWRDNLAISIAESIFILRKGDEGWVQTVSWMLTNHEAYFKKIGLNCKTYNIEFVQLINKVLNLNLCAEQS